MREGYGVVPGLDGTVDIEVVPMVDGEVRLRSGVVVPVRPFFGVLAVRPDPALGPLGTIPPGPFGGNIDCRELVAGTRLLLPTFTEGAGFLIGDGHGTQGDGEITETALECAMRGTIRLTSRPQLPTDRPLAATPDATLFFGFGPTFDAAALVTSWPTPPGGCAEGEGEHDDRAEHASQDRDHEEVGQRDRVGHPERRWRPSWPAPRAPRDRTA